MPDVLVTPLGFAPGAVSGAFFTLRQNGFRDVTTVIAVGTSHRNVLQADSYLRDILSPEFDYRFHYIPYPEIRERDGSTNTYASHFGLALEEAQRIVGGGKIHVCVTPGRSGMGALAALATNLYGTDYLWHYWVTDEIERKGRVEQLERPFDLSNKYLNPTVEEGASELVQLPFVDLRPLQTLIWQYQKTGQYPDENSPYFPLFSKQDMTLLQKIFPAGLTIENADRIMQIAQAYPTLSPAEQEQQWEEVIVLLAKSGVIDVATRDRIRTLVRTNPQRVLEVLQQSPDRTGFLSRMGNWLRSHSVEVTGVSAIVNILLKVIELAMK